MKNERSLVSVVDDDESIRESLPDLLRVRFFGPGLFVGGGVSHVSLCRPDQMFGPRYRYAGYDRTRSPTRVDPPRPKDSHCLHHRSQGRVCSQARLRAGSRMPAQAIQ